MKTRLLRQLRNNAKYQYWIEEHKGQVGRYWVRTPKCSTGCYLEAFISLIDAERFLKAKRRSFILENIYKRKESKGKYKLDL